MQEEIEKIVYEVSELLFKYIKAKQKGGDRSVAIDTICKSLSFDGKIRTNMLYYALYEYDKKEQE